MENKRGVNNQQDRISFYSSTRSTLENIMKKIMAEISDARRKVIVIEGFRHLHNEIAVEINGCSVKCEPFICNSCAVDIVKDIVKKLDFFNSQYTNKKNIEAVKVAERKDLIKMIEENNENVRNIIRDKSKGSTISGCDKDKMDVWDKIK